MIIKWFGQLTLLSQLFLIYFLLINLITFFYFGLDKLKSQFHSERISEKTLWLLTLIGGSIGTLLGMNFFRHKTKKLSFQTIIAVILALQILIIYLVSLAI